MKLGETKKKNEKKSTAKQKIAKVAANFIASGIAAMNIVMTAFAEGEGGTGGGTGGGIDKTFASDMLDIAWWVVLGICGVFGGLGLVKMIQGQSEEDTRARNNGIVTLVIAAVAIVAIVAIKGKTT